MAVSGESATKMQRKRSWEESLEPRRMDFSVSKVHLPVLHAFLVGSCISEGFQVAEEVFIAVVHM